MKTTAYGPRTTRKLQAQWRTIMLDSRRDHKRVNAATRFACSGGLRPGTGRWYAAALWSYNQH
jgi:hypothetical protein